MELKVGQLIFLKDTKKYACILSWRENKVKIEKLGLTNATNEEVDIEKISAVRTRKINGIKDVLKVGDIIITNGSSNGIIEENHSLWVYGKIGEIIEDKFYVWNNTHNGSRGTKTPKGFEHSWQVDFDNLKARIIILSVESTKEDKKCFGCKEDFEGEEEQIGADGKSYCEDCFEDKFFVCEECDEVIWKDDACSPEGEDRILCQSCYDENYAKCSHCDCELLIDGDYTHHHDGDYYCDDCFNERFGNCSDCGEVFYNDDLSYDEDSDEYLCEHCRVHSQSKDIHDYGYRPEPEFKKEKWEDDLYLGIELEVLHEEHAAKSSKLIAFLEKIKVKNRFYLKHDGSLEGKGFEIVSHPETLKSIHRNIKLIKILEWLNKNDFDSEKSGKCGLHIHINKAILEDLDITKLRLFFKVNQEQLQIFSRRDGESDFAKFEKRDIKDIIHGENDSDRYNAINLNSSRDTVELRLFRGSLDYERVLSILQFSDAIVRFVKKVGITCFIYGEGKYRKNSWGLFIDWCKEENRYSTLLKHLEKEKLMEVK